MQINGQPISTAAGSTLSQLLAQQGFDVARVAVELNGKIICRSDFSISCLYNDFLYIF